MWPKTICSTGDKKHDRELKPCSSLASFLMRCWQVMGKSEGLSFSEHSQGKIGLLFMINYSLIHFTLKEVPLSVSSLWDFYCVCCLRKAMNRFRQMGFKVSLWNGNFSLANVTFILVCVGCFFFFFFYFPVTPIKIFAILGTNSLTVSVDSKLHFLASTLSM